MPNSYAQTANLTCPNCQKPFQAEIWLIVDAAERPDLLQLIQQGRLHDVACPTCGPFGQADAPLLIFLPAAFHLPGGDGSGARLIFSSVRQANPRQSVQQENQLLTHLVQSLGDAWQDAWLEQITEMPRDQLPGAFVHGPEAPADNMEQKIAAELERLRQEDPQAYQQLQEQARQLAKALPLIQTLQQFSQAKTWDESQRVVEQHPELLSDETDALLGQLLAAAEFQGDENSQTLLAEHRTLLQRCRAIGVANAFAEKMGLTPEQLEAANALAEMPPALREVVEELARSGVRIDSQEDLLRALDARPDLRQKLEAAAASSGKGPSIPPQFQSDLRQAMEGLQRYQQTGQLAALEAAAQAWQRILAQPAFHTTPERFQLMAMNNAGGVFLYRYQCRKEIEDLNRALELWQAAVRQTPPDSPNLPALLNNLGAGLSDRYRRTGAMAELEEAIRSWQAAARQTPPDSPNLPALLNNLGNGLNDRYHRTGALSDLEEAIHSWQAAARQTPPDSPDLPSLLNNLGSGLRDRYHRTGALSDLEEAIRVFQAAARQTPPNSPDLPMYLNNLGAGLNDRYSLTGELADLEEAIRSWQAAARQTPSDSPNLPGYLNNLGSGLRDRYSRTGELADLEEAIRVSQAAAQQTPPDSPDLPSLLNNLGIGLSDRCRRTGALADLEEAICSWQAAVRQTPPDSPNLPSLLNNLGIGLSDRYRRTGALSDASASQTLEEAIRAFREAARLTPPDSPHQPGYLNNLSNGLWTRYRRTGALPDLEEAICSWQTAARQTPPDSPDLPIYLNNLGSGLWTRYRRTGALADLEEAIRIYKTAVRQTPPDSPDLPMYLTNLGNGLWTRYRRMGALSDLEEAIRSWQAAVQQTPANSPDLPIYLNNLGNGISDRYRRTGALSDLEEAIRVYQAAARQMPPDSPDLPMYLNGLGSGISDRYRRTGALSDLEEAIRSWQAAARLTPPDSPDLPMYLNNLGNGLSDRYHQTGALSDLEEATASYRQACELGQVVSQEITLTSSQNWGRWALERGSWAEACQAYTFGLQASQRLFQKQTSRAAKESWLGEARGVAAQAAFAFAKTENLSQALETLESGRARLLGEALERSRRDLERLSEIGQQDLLARYRAASQGLDDRLALASLESRPGEPAAPRPPDWLQQVETAQAELEAVIGQIRLIPGYETFLGSLRLEQIQQQAKDAPLVYLAATPAGGLALLVTPDEIQVIWLDALTEAALDGWLVRRDGENVAGGYLPGALGQHAWLAESLDDLLPRLGEAIMGPVAAGLRRRQAAAVTLIPGGRLGLLPLHAARYTHNGQELHFLDEFEVRYAASAQALASARQQHAVRSRRPLRLAGVGNPLPAAPSLPYAQAELQEIAASFGGDSQPLYGEAATRQALLSTLADASHLHLSCHGMFNPQQPLDSALSLAHEETLTLREVLDQPNLWGMRLVVLSACQTAIADFNNLPDEAIGLPGGFTQAGIPGVVGTLWSVSDLSTALLMIRFYEYHLQGDPQDGAGPMSPGRALQAAQRWLRQVTADELTTYFAGHKALADLRQQPAAAKLLPLQVAAEGVLHFGSMEPEARPFHDQPYHWAPFVFYGV